MNILCDKFDLKTLTPERIVLLRLHLRELALRDIKAVHTRWILGEIQADEAVRKMEHIAVSVWQLEDE